MIDNNLLMKLKGVLARHPQVLSAYLYGSCLEGKSNPVVGVDLALSLSDKALLPAISSDSAS